MTETTTATSAGEFHIGGELPVRRMGFGSMQLMGPNGFGAARDVAEAVRVLRRARELGVTFFDTADAYGPFVAEKLIAQALHPYESEVVIATKGGFVRNERGDWIADGRPEHLREAVDGSLRRLQLESIPLYQLHRIDPRVPLADQVGTLAEMVDQGKVRFVGLSEVSVAQLQAAQEITPIATVQNLFNLSDRRAADLVRFSERHRIGFIPWFPLATGRLLRDPDLLRIARRTGAGPSQIALAWLLQHSSSIIPIPGTSRVPHLEDNVAAAGVRLDGEEVAELDALA